MNFWQAANEISERRSRGSQRTAHKMKGRGTGLRRLSQRIFSSLQQRTKCELSFLWGKAIQIIGSGNKFRARSSRVCVLLNFPASQARQNYFSFIVFSFAA